MVPGVELSYLTVIVSQALLMNLSSLLYRAIIKVRILLITCHGRRKMAITYDFYF